ncbi:hypothetical protein BDR04DRAFT_1087468, partial [Suillus decipiens]
MSIVRPILPSHWLQNRLSGRPSGRYRYAWTSVAIVDVPYTTGIRRNASAREKRRSIMEYLTASTSRPPNSSTTQQSRPSHFRKHIYLHHSQTSIINPHATIKHADHWTRFWLFVCCTSPDHTDG